MGCSFFYDPFLKEKDIAHTLLSKQTKRNVYNLALTGSSVAESLYILRNYDDNIALKKILNNDFNIEHIIINYMPWHVKSLLISPRGMCPRFKKDNGKLILNTNPLYNTEICTALNILVRRNTQYNTLKKSKKKLKNNLVKMQNLLFSLSKNLDLKIGIN